MFELSPREALALAGRHLTLALMFFLPRNRRIALERRLRGKEEYRKLQSADWVLMSWGKSGRTWFRVMLSRCYQLRYGLPDNRLLEFDNLHRANAAVPRVLFSHNNYMRDYLRNWSDLEHFRGKRVVLLVRDPRDVAVSQFFQWKFRMRPGKKLLNDYPPHGAEVDVYDFVTNPACGVPRIVDYFNGWAQAIEMMGDKLLIVRYEDMRQDPAATMTRVLDFVGTPCTPDVVAQAVEFAALDNMKKLEEDKSFRGSGQRVKPGDRNNPDSFKVRRGKVGGYRDYFSDEQLAVIDPMVEQQLDPVFGYRPLNPEP